METIHSLRQFPRLSHRWTDGGYQPVLVDGVTTALGWTVAVVKPKTEPKGDYAAGVGNFLGDDADAERYPAGFQVLPRRWVVERTFAWLLNQRRLSKAYDLLPRTSEAWIYLTTSRLLLRRLTRPSS